MHELLQTQADLLLFVVEGNHDHVNLIAFVQHFGGVLDACPTDFTDVKKTVNTPEVDEGTVVFDGLHGAGELLAFLDGEPQGFFGLLSFRFQTGTTADDQIALLPVRLDDLHGQFLTDKRLEILDKLQIELACRQEAPQTADFDLQSALVGLGHHTIDDLPLPDRVPIGGHALLAARQIRVDQAFVGLHFADKDLKLLPDFRQFRRFKLPYRYHAGRPVAQIQKDAVAMDGIDLALQPSAFFQFLLTGLFGTVRLLRRLFDACRIDNLLFAGQCGRNLRLQFVA